MSTYLYLECRDHNPPLKANRENESGQHKRDIPEILKDIANRDQLVRLWNESRLENYDGSNTSPYFITATASFLADHPNCNIGIVDEYDVHYDHNGNPICLPTITGLVIPANTEQPPYLKTLRLNHLEDFQKVVGGHIHNINILPGINAYVNSLNVIGKTGNLSFNKRASAMLAPVGIPSQIAGDIIFFGQDPNWKHDIDIDPELAKKIIDITDIGA